MNLLKRHFFRKYVVRNMQTAIFAIDTILKVVRPVITVLPGRQGCFVVSVVRSLRHTNVS